MQQFESTFFDQSTGSIATTPRVTFPSVGNGRRACVARQPGHHAQLYDMHPMIERAGQHFQPGSGLFIQRPVSGIESSQVLDQSLTPAIEDFLRRNIPARQPVVEYAPQGPNESIQNVGWRVDEILFDPQVLLDVLRYVLKQYATFGNGPC